MTRPRPFFRTPGFVVLVIIGLLFLLYASLQGHQGNAVHLYRADRQVYVSMKDFGQVVQYQVFEKDIANLPEKVEATYEESGKIFTLGEDAPPKALKLDEKTTLSFPGSVVSTEMYSNTLYVVDQMSGIYRYWEGQPKEQDQPDIAFYGARDIAVMAGYTFVAGGEAGIYIYASDTPTTTLAQTKVIETDGAAEALALVTREGTEAIKEEDFSTGREKTIEVEKIVSATLYVAEGSRGVEVFDVTQPITPSLPIKISQEGHVHNLTLDGNLLYVSRGVQGWSVLDVKDPRSFQELVTLETRGDVRDIAVNEMYIAVADGNSGLLVYRNNKDPQKLNQVPVVIDLPGFVGSVELLRNYALVADGVEGVRVIDLANLERYVVRATAATPGEYTLQQVWANRNQPEGSPEQAKYKRSLNDLRNEAIMLAAGLLATFFFVSIVTLPAYSLRYWLHSQHSQPVTVVAGQVVSLPETHHAEHMRAIHIDTASAAAVIGPNHQRWLGPGLAFLQPRERLARTIDLSPTLLISGPYFSEDPFAGEAAEETPHQQLERLVRQKQTEAKTRDETTVIPNFLIDVGVAGNPGDGNSQYGYSAANAQLAMQPDLLAYHQTLPNMSPAVGWYELVTQYATQLWVQHLGKYTLQELFTPLPDPQGVFPAEVRTGLQRVAWLMQRHLTEPQAPRLDANGAPTGQMMDSAAFAAMQQRGLRVSRLQVLNLRLDPAVANALQNGWLDGWEAAALAELQQTQARHAQALVQARQAARERFRNIVDHPRQTRQTQAGNVPLAPREILVGWVQGTLNLSELTPEMRQRLNDLLATLEGWD